MTGAAKEVLLFFCAVSLILRPTVAQILVSDDPVHRANYVLNILNMTLAEHGNLVGGEYQERCTEQYVEENVLAHFDRSVLRQDERLEARINCSTIDERWCRSTCPKFELEYRDCINPKETGARNDAPFGCICDPPLTWRMAALHEIDRCGKKGAL